MPYQRSAPPSQPVACPICGRLLKWMPERWLAEFECEGCGPFADFAGAAVVSGEPHRSPHTSRPLGSTAPPHDKQDEEDTDGSGGASQQG